MDIEVGLKAITEASEELSKGALGNADHSGTLDYVTPEDIVAAARLTKTGKVFAFSIPLAPIRRPSNK